MFIAYRLGYAQHVMKKCPFCAEEIQVEAIKCKHCGEFLDPRYKSRKEDRPWYFRTPTIVTALLLVMPLALPLVWFNPYYSRNVKVVITLAVLIGTYFLWGMTTQALKGLEEYYKLIM